MPKKRISKIHLIDTDEELNLHKKLFDFFAKKKIVNYSYCPENSEIITKLIYYFNGSEKSGLDLNKSIALIGPPGSGKTIIMEIFAEYLKAIATPNYNIFRTTSIEQLKEYYKANNQLNYFTTNYTQSAYTVLSKPFSLCVNEAFIYYNEKSYGTDISEIFNSFWMLRYEVFQTFGKLTHLTSNLDTEDMKKTIDPVLFDRIKEMVNILVLNIKSWRK